MRAAFAITGALLTITFIMAASHDVSREWRPIQNEYLERAMARADSDRLRTAVSQIEPGIKQDFLPNLGRTDRCRTCHLGVDNPSMKGAPEPLASHPGSLLESHPPERFGCTVCHRGQGLATTTIAAHANDIKFWEEPMLPPPYTEATCEHCHKDVEIKGATALNDGRRIFHRKGCAGCHKVYGKGGTLGPVLTDLGAASTYLKHPIPENLETYAARVGGDLNLAYIYESIEEPEAQPESTTMPKYDLSAWESRALTVYIKGLSSEELPVVYRPVRSGEKKTPTGRALFLRYCSACHGSNGEGGIRVGRMGTTLNNQDFLALASSEFIRGIVVGGRNSENKVMPAWGESAGGLGDQEIGLLVGHILSWGAGSPGKGSPGQVSLVASNGEVGDAIGLYQRACADCHGNRREGGIGPSLGSPEFFQIASARFLAETLETGRPGTAMPAWDSLTAEQISTLIRFLGSYDFPVTTSSEVSIRGDRILGRTVFQSRCATCHGRGGEGGIGPSLNSAEIAALASDRFLIETVVRGRRDSGMPEWSGLPPDHLSAVVTHLKTLGTPARLSAIPSDTGNSVSTSEPFEGVCAGCHGSAGEGGTGPAIGSADFLGLADDRFLAGTIKYGRTGTEMRPHGLVPSALAEYTDQEILNIIQHLRGLGEHRAIRQTIRGSVDAGREWYGRVCVNCHGHRGRGGTGPALANPYFLKVASDGFLQAQMALGRSGTEMRPMTPYAGGVVEIGRGRINDIIAYLREQSHSYGTEGVAVQTAYGSVDRGERWFTSVCAMCHGIKGRGTAAAPGLNDANFLGFATDGFLQGTMIRGRMHTGMRAFSRHGDGIAAFSARDITDIAAYIRSWVNPQIGVAREPTFKIGTGTSAPVIVQVREE